MTSELTARLLIGSRCCDALDPCATCRGRRSQVAAARHAERVAAMTAEAPKIPAPRAPSELLAAA